MVLVCLPSDALLQHLPSYLGFSYLGRGVSLHGCSSKVHLLLLTLDEGCLLTAALPDLQRGIAPLGPPVPAQPPLLWCGVGPSGRRPWAWAWGSSSQPPPWPRTRGSSSQLLPLTSTWVALLSCSCAVAAWHSHPLLLTSDVGNSSWPLPFAHGVLLASAPDLGRGVATLGHAAAGA